MAKACCVAFGRDGISIREKRIFSRPSPETKDMFWDSVLETWGEKPQVFTEVLPSMNMESGSLALMLVNTGFVHQGLLDCLSHFIAVCWEPRGMMASGRE